MHFSKPESAPVVPSFQSDGTLMDLANPVLADIFWPDVAGRLSRIIRFNGAAGALPVGQHCVMGADALFRETGDGVAAGYFLLHDAHEAPIGDLIRPTALAIEFHLSAVLAERGCTAEQTTGAARQAIHRLKASLDAVIHQAANLPPIDAMPLYRRLVAEMDERMCMVEAHALFGVRKSIPLVRSDLPSPRLTGALTPWGAAKAEEAFLDRLERYLGIVARIAA